MIRVVKIGFDHWADPSSLYFRVDWATHLKKKHDHVFFGQPIGPMFFTIGLDRSSGLRDDPLKINL